MSLHSYTEGEHDDDEDRLTVLAKVMDDVADGSGPAPGGIVPSANIDIGSHEHLPVPQPQPPKTEAIKLFGRPVNSALNKPIPDIDRAARFAIATVVGISLLAPMTALTYIHRRAFVLLIVCVFVLFIAMVMPMVVHSSTQDVIVATATYTAVLVVFVGQSNPGMNQVEG